VNATAPHPAPVRLTAPIRLAVIGGGITGLAAAHRAIELCTAAELPLALTLFEDQSRLGGLFGSEQIGDYLIERGADSFITNKPHGLHLCRRLGLEDQLIPTNARFRRSLILCHGRPVPTPAGFHLIAPAQLWPMLTTPLLSWRGKVRLLQERLIPRKRLAGDESLADFTRRRFGSEVLDRIVQPMVGGIYTSDPEKLSLAATLPRFLEMEQKYGSLIKALRRQPQPSSNGPDIQSASGARYGLFVAFKNGMQQLLDTLEQRIVLHTQHRAEPRVTSLLRKERVWQLTTAHGRTREFDGVILALPAHAAAELLKETSPECSRRLRRIESASSAIVVTVHDLATIRHPLDAFGLVIPAVEHRKILAVSFLSRKFEGRAPAGKIILRTFVGGAMQPEELVPDDEQLLGTVTGELASLFGISTRPEVALVTRYPNGMPQYHVGHLDRIRMIEELSQKIPQLELAGNFFRGVGIPDCIQSGEEAAERLIKELSCQKRENSENGESST